ncbi:MAG TPA: TonB-dependent siderophore receptor [Stenomitos sp.]
MKKQPRLYFWGSLGSLSVLAFVPTAVGARPVVERSLAPVVATEREPLVLQAQADQNGNSISISDISLISNDEGLDIVLASDRPPASPVETRTEGYDIIFDVPNASLNLSTGKTYDIENPRPTVARIQVLPLDAQTVRVRVVGRNVLPQVAIIIGNPASSTQQVRVTPPKSGDNLGDLPSEQLSPGTSSNGNAIGETPGNAPTEETAPGDELEIVVTADRADDPSAYSVPNASTATKTDTPLRDIPQSIQVVPQQVIEDQGATQLKDIVRNVSGVVRADDFGGGGDGFAIRGFQSPNILRDGVRGNSVVSAFSNFGEPSNLERVEVLKGPASVLYGNVEPGGVINTVSKQPLSDPYYSASFSVGSFEFFQPEFDISGPLTDDKKLLYRLNGLYQNSSSFRDFTQIQRVFISPKISWKISDRTQLNFNLDFLNDRRPFDAGLVAIGRKVADIPISRRLGEPGDFRDYENLGLGYTLEHEFNDNLKIRNTFRADFTNVETQAFRAREIIDPVKGILEREFRTTQGDRKSYSLQTDLIGKFETGPIKHEVLFGIDLARIEEDESGRRVRPYAPINIFRPNYGAPIPNNPPLFFSSEVRYSALGVYLQDQIELRDNLKLLVGGRFDLIRNTTRDVLFGGTSTQNDSAFSPRVGLVYQPIEPLSLYASFSRSFNPNVGILDRQRQPLDPERGTQYEVGMKAELFGGKLTSTLAFYHLTKTNVAVTDPQDDNFSLAAGKIRSQGIELDVSAQILPGWKVIASYAYTDAEVTEGDEFLPTGNRPPSIPRHSASLWSTYEFQSGTLKGFGFGGGLFFVGEREGDFDNSFRLPGYLRADASLFYRRKNWSASLNVQNLFDTKYFEVAEFRESVQPGAPLTVVGKISVEF